MSRIVLCLVVMLGFAGCATQSWYHPSKSQEQFNQDKYSCSQNAAQTYPTVIQKQSYGSGYATPAQTACTTTNSQIVCTTTPGTYTPPPSVTVDANEGNRSDSFNSCMQSMGWSLMNKEEMVAAQKITGSRTEVAKQQLAKLEIEANELCGKEEYKIVYRKSACKTDSINLEQLSDSTKITMIEKVRFMALHNEKDSLRKRRVEIYNAAGDPVAVKLANLSERNRIEEEKIATSIYEGKITWGEYNKNRKEISAAAREEYSAITIRK